jgi:DNA-binding GntR family transcriptional regulator
MSGHSVYLGFLHELIARSSLIILLYRRHDTPACGTDHHADIVMAIRDRDKARARALMIGHLVDIEAELFLKDIVPDDRRLADVLGA